jgi:DTW domain-containing protein YfiP
VINKDKKECAAGICKECQLVNRLCYCDLIPSIETRTKVSVILHSCEQGRNSNTGRLAHRALVNSDLRVFGDRTDWRQWQGLEAEGYQAFILFPRSPRTLTPEFIAGLAKPVQLLIPDGNWHQGNSMSRRLAIHYGLPTVSLPEIPESYYPLRRRHSEQNGVSTIEAIAAALRLLDGDTASQQLQDIFQTMLSRRLSLRGLNPLAQV